MILVVFGVLYAVAAAMLLWSRTELGRFLAETPRIADDASLDRFKVLARRQMHLALALIAVLGAGIIVAMMVISRYGLAGFALVLITNVVVLGLGLFHKRIEVRARTLPAGSDALGQEYRRVSESWTKKALPDF